MSRYEEISINPHVKSHSICNRMIQFASLEMISHHLHELDLRLERIQHDIGQVGAAYLSRLATHTHETLVESYCDLMHKNEMLNELMGQAAAIYEMSLANPFHSRRQRNQWLHVEVAARKATMRKIYQVFSEYADYTETLLYWRIGVTSEKREYKYSIFDGSLLMKKAFSVETLDVKRYLLEFDRVFSRLYQIRKQVRSIDLMILECHENLQRQYYIDQFTEELG